MGLLSHPRYLAGVELGRGGQAVVLRVTDREASARQLVAKLWQPGAFREELLAGEFALLSRVHAPGLVRAHDFGRDSVTGAPFLVEDYVAGPDARAWVRQASDARTRVTRIRELMAHVAATLALLHDSGFLHGDLKPAHVRIPASGRAMLLDLGGAVYRARDAVALTPGYAAPELLAGAPPSPRSDLYAFGALLWSVASGQSPERDGLLPVRQLAAELPPSLGDLIDALLAKHPADRPNDARAVLLALGSESAHVPSSAEIRLERSASISSGPREQELQMLFGARDSVLYVTGPAGMGKSHALSELHTRALLAGRDARLLRFPCADAELVLRLLAWLRGNEAARPFVARSDEPLLLALDDLELAPAELKGALESFRCRPEASRIANVVAALRIAPRDAPSVELAALGEAQMAALLVELGEAPERVAELATASGGNPAYVAAALGRVPLTRGAALERARTLTAGARELLAALAVLGPFGSDVASLLRASDSTAALAELSAAGLVTRAAAQDRSAQYALAYAPLAGELADALADFEVIDRLASALLDGDFRARAALLLAAANAPHPPARRSELLALAAERARAEGLRGEETEALLALAADPSERTVPLLTALDHATRGGGSIGLHPELVTWLCAAAEREPSLVVLSLRRQAEQKARAGEGEQAEALARAALHAAERRAEPAEQALAWSTLGAVALYRADWAAADSALAHAMAVSSTGAVDDPEELARLHHNRGVVALYRHRVDEASEAFERALWTKRALGDRAGTWACLLNLGLARTYLGRFADAEHALLESLAICKTLGQRSGIAWALTALADVALRRKDALGTERWIAEAEQLASDLPEPVLADLALLRAELGLLEGDARRAFDALATISDQATAGDALVATRALVVKSRAHLAALPADRRRAARLAIQAVRRARAAALPEPEARAIEALRQARRRRVVPVRPLSPSSYTAEVSEAESNERLWGLLAGIARDPDLDAAARALCLWVLEESGAERVFLASLDRHGRPARAWGFDLDGLPLGDAARRVDASAIEAALRGDGLAHQPLARTPGGQGARLVSVGPDNQRSLRGALLLEHRFAPGAFDAVDAGRARRWGVVANLVLALPTTAVRQTEPQPSAASALESKPIGDRPDEPSTVLPLRGRRRVFGGIIGESAVLDHALSRLDAAVDSDLPVLLTGETGSGKELFARALHEAGARGGGPFVAINCAAVPESLFEAELFGHERGSFTGAERARGGLIARAEGGTLFLDEIGELPLSRQATLLRALSTNRYRAVGSDQEKTFDLRIVSATNRALEREVEAGCFRRDLFFRLNVLEVHVPSLRERPEDVLPIALEVLRQHGSDARFAEAAVRALEAHSWPGNVRELEHLCQRLAAHGGSRIELEHLPREIRAAARAAAPLRPRPETPDQERRETLAALEAESGNLTRAAARLGITRHGLKKKMLRLGLRERGASGRQG